MGGGVRGYSLFSPTLEIYLKLNVRQKGSTNLIRGKAVQVEKCGRGRRSEAVKEQRETKHRHVLQATKRKILNVIFP